MPLQPGRHPEEARRVVIQRIERAVYGCDDLDTCHRFFTDFGLEEICADGEGVDFRTRVGQVVSVRRESDVTLPAALEKGPTLREIVWGVDDQAALDRLVADLGRDRDVEIDDQGVAHTLDETGFGLGIAVAAPTDPAVVPAALNVMGAVTRWNKALPRPSQVRPLRICHVAWNIPKEGREKAVAFYVDRLGFRVTDDVKPMGTFMQCEGDDDQHNLLLCHRPDRAGVNHTSYEVSSVDEVILGGNQMVEKGWREARRLGRHTVGSNIFRFVHAPCGGRLEYAADMDRVDDSYGPNVHEETPPHTLWTLHTNRDGEQ